MFGFRFSLWKGSWMLIISVGGAPPGPEKSKKNISKLKERVNQFTWWCQIKMREGICVFYTMSKNYPSGISWEQIHNLIFLRTPCNQRPQNVHLRIAKRHNVHTIYIYGLFWSAHVTWELSLSKVELCGTRKPLMWANSSLDLRYNHGGRGHSIKWEQICISAHMK